VVAQAVFDLIEAAPAELAERRLRHFVREAWGVIEPFTIFKANWHIDAICDHLEAVEAGQIRNLLVTMPPRMMKSLTISVFYPAWRWINRPGMRFLYASRTARTSPRCIASPRAVSLSLTGIRHAGAIGSPWPMIRTSRRDLRTTSAGRATPLRSAAW
jgi:hypothetical protein